MSKRDLQGATVVVVGASSGIGRATAIEFARQGARLVLAARRKAALEEVVRDCEGQGTQALAVPTDVTDAQAVKRLAAKAAKAFGGRIDVWVNNVGAGAVGEFTETPIEAHDQVIRTNLMGHLHGAHAVLPYFKQQQSGVLINTISFGAWVPAPYAVAYSASKFGLRGFSEALRGELSRWPDIHVCDVFPSFIDTPGIVNAANYTGRKIGAATLAYEPQKVARAIVSLARQPRGSATVGLVATLARLGHAISPAFTRWAAARFTEAYLTQSPSAATTDGNLFEPQSQESGVFGSHRLSLQPAWKSVASVGLIAGAAAGLKLLWPRR